MARIDIDERVRRKHNGDLGIVIERIFDSHWLRVRFDAHPNHKKGYTLTLKDTAVTRVGGDSE